MLIPLVYDVSGALKQFILGYTVVLRFWKSQKAKRKTGRLPGKEIKYQFLFENTIKAVDRVSRR